MLLLDQVINKKLGKPFIKIPTEGPLLMLSPTEVKALLSDKFKKIQSKLDYHHAAEKLTSDDSIPYLKVENPVKNQSTNTSKTIKSPSQKSTVDFAKPPRSSRETSSYNNLQEIMKQQSQEKQQSKNSAIKSILKQSVTKKNNGSKHNFLLSMSESKQNKKGITFNETVSGFAGIDDLDRQIDIDIHQLKMQGNSPLNIDNITPTSISNTGSEVTSMDQLSLQNQVIKLKTDNEIMTITMRHLQDELNFKSETIRKQQQELASLRQTVLDIQAESQRFQAQSQWQEIKNKENFGNKTSLSTQCTDGYEKPSLTQERGAYRSKILKEQNDNYLQNRDNSKNSQQYEYRETLQNQYMNVINQTNQTPTLKPSRFYDYKPILHAQSSSQLVTDMKDMRNNITSSERQFQDFDEEFNKIFNNS